MSESILLNLQAEQAELEAIAAEAIGWLPLGDCTYLHVGNEEEPVISVVGVPDASMAGINVLLLG